MTADRDKETIALVSKYLTDHKTEANKKKQAQEFLTSKVNLLLNHKINVDENPTDVNEKN
jgi:hypothetical protein